jgi:hypothetical protein
MGLMSSIIKLVSDGEIANRFRPKFPLDEFREQCCGRCDAVDEMNIPFEVQFSGAYNRDGWQICELGVWREGKYGKEFPIEIFKFDLDERVWK